LEWLLEAVLAKGLWRRNKVALGEKVDASLAYMAGLSYRDAAYVLEIVRASHVAVWTWVQRLKRLALRVERWLGTLKDKTRRFNNFPVKKP